MKLTLLLISILFSSFQLAGSELLERWDVKPRDDLFENKVGTFIENIRLNDAKGKLHSLYSKETALTVLTIFDVDCPISLKLVPKVQRLEKEYPQVSFKHIFISRLTTVENVLKEYKKRALTGQLLIDNKGDFARLLKVKTTCENFIIDSQGTLLYRGAVDDQYGINIVKENAETLYLKNALNSLLQGHTVTYPLTGAPGCLLDTEPESSTKGDVTFHKDIARILQNRCQQCHRQGGVGPFELMTYEQAKERRKMISYVVEKDIMPPWFAEDNRKWKQNYDLSKGEKETLLKWLSSGMPEGNPAHAPKALQWSKEGIIKNPDLVLTFPKVNVQAEGFMRYKYLTVKVPITEDKWVKAVETRTKNPQVLHHALSFLTNSPNKQPVNAAAGFYSGYVPGAVINVFPEDTGKFLPKGSYIMVQLHYTPNGTAVEDEVSLAFEFFDEKPKFESITKSAFTRNLKIPPHEENYIAVAEHKFSEDGYLTGFNPHAHLRGKSFKYELFLPNGKKETLLNIPKYDFNWQINYQPVEAVFAPAGSTVKVTAVYDNSTKNKNNPNPNVTVRFGEQTNNEMMIGYFEWHSSGSTAQSGSKSTSLDTLPKALKELLDSTRKKLEDGSIDKQQARKVLMKAVKTGIKNGEYSEQDIMKYANTIRQEIQNL